MNNRLTETAPEARSSIFDIEMYVPGESGSGHDGPIIKLSSNETPMGASPKAIAAAQAELEALQLYPDGGANKLRQAIAARYSLNVEQIVCGAGSDELLNLLAMAYLKPGDEAIYTEHGFLVYRIAILAQDAVPVVAKERDLTTDVDAILACVTERTKMVFIANPNNPTGTYIPFDEVRRLRAELPDRVLLVLDGAYAEYVQRNDYETGLELVATTNNTVMTRTFSKLHGLAALRLGWAFCPNAVADVLNRIRGPFNVSSMAIAAGTAAIEDQAHQDTTVAINTSELERLSGALAALGLEVTPSVANFILVHFPNDRAATGANAFLQTRGIIVRGVASYGLPDALRITVGLPEQNDAVIDALTTFAAGDAASETEAV